MLDFGITLITFAGLVLVSKINFALDGFVAIGLGVSIGVSAIKNVIKQAKYLISGDLI